MENENRATGKRVLLLLFPLLLLPHPARASSCENIFVSSTGDAPLSWPGARTLDPDAAQKDPITQDLLEAYFSLSVATQERGSLPRYLKPQALVYLVDALPLREQKELSAGLWRTRRNLRRRPSLSVRNALRAGAGKETLATIALVDRQIRALKREHKTAVGLALENHDGRGQFYAGKPYSVHLHRVRDVLKRFGMGPRDSVLGLILGTAAWLHDIIEDTPVTREMLAAALGPELAEIVWNVTNEPRSATLSKEERKRATLEKTASRMESRILKVADRIANVEESLANYFLGRPTKIEKYHAEWPLFQRYLRKAGEVPEMWEHLERLLTDTRYAREFTLRHLNESGGRQEL